MRALYPVIPVIVFLLLSSCVEKLPDYNAHTLHLMIDFEEEVPEEYRAGAKVVLTNLTRNYSLTEYSNDSAFVDFSDLEPGFYSATLTHSYSEQDTAFNLNGLKLIDIFDSLVDTLETVCSKTNAFVIKQFYYSACLTPAGNQYSSDQFVEIHNNSNLLQYADGLTLIEHESYSREESYFNFLEDTVVARMIWTIPGDGSQYPVEPGASIVIARDGINHQDSVYGNPLCPVNLEYADFEFYVHSESGDDLDAPYADNMVENLFTYRGTDVVFHTRGGSAIAIARIPGTQEEKQEYVDNHQITKVDIPTRYYGKIPIEWILDAVEVTWDEAHAIYKRFPVELDAGYTYVEAGSRSGKCIRRKVKEVVDGRYIYEDTNKSTDDFLKDADPKPWINE